MEVSNQIPEEDRKKIEKQTEHFQDEWNKEFYNKGASFGYTLGLQSAEKRVKELEDIMKLYFDLMIRSETEQHFEHLLQEHDWNNKAKQLLSK